MDELEEPTKCHVCKNAVLYGSRHHACGSYVMKMERQINEKDKEIQIRTKEHATGFYEPTWFGIKVLGPVSNGSRRVKLRCLNCGHEYISDSAPAHRAIFPPNAKLTGRTT